jgi:prepilin-type N-terminal cleavage/methylation domain-containing protein
MKCKREFGFTLVELMVVVLILGALAFVAIPRIGKSTDTAKTNACTTNIDLLNAQAELVYATDGTWPADFAALSGDTDLFPDGPPECPHTDAYVFGTDHRITPHTH